MGLSYKNAGVDIDAGNKLVDLIKPAIRSTHRPEVMSSIGGFGGLFALQQDKYQEPILVSGTDGVGTKLRLAQQLNQHATIGIDLVAMCVNDLIVQGAEPLFFLDYFACSKLDNEVAASVIQGIGAGCQLAGCALIGGETAEMPGMYEPGDYDLAGFAVGIVEKSGMQSPDNVQPDDVLLGLVSSGPHSNGYSLIRAILERSGISPDTPFGDSTLGLTLLEPTRIYVKPLLALLDVVPVSAICHVTGGGLTENLPRVLPENTAAEIDLGSWQAPEIFQWLQEQGNIDSAEMLRTFNCGIGMVLAVRPDNVEAAISSLESDNQTVFRIGRVTAAEGPAEVAYV